MPPRDPAALEDFERQKWSKWGAARGSLMLLFFSLSFGAGGEDGGGGGGVDGVLQAKIGSCESGI